jgi:hypothetical protein
VATTPGRCSLMLFMGRSKGGMGGLGWWGHGGGGTGGEGRATPGSYNLNADLVGRTVEMWCVRGGEEESECGVAVTLPLAGV